MNLRQRALIDIKAGLLRASPNLLLQHGGSSLEYLLTLGRDALLIFNFVEVSHDRRPTLVRFNEIHLRASFVCFS